MENEIENNDKLILSDNSTQLDRISYAVRLLEEAKTLDEIKEIKDQGKAINAFAKAKRLGKDSINKSNELIIEAGIRFSIMKKEGQEKGTIQDKHTNQYNASSLLELADIGVTKRESHINDTLARDVEITKNVIDELLEKGKLISENAVCTGIKKKIKQQSDEDDEKTKITHRIISVAAKDAFGAKFGSGENEQVTSDLILWMLEEFIPKVRDSKSVSMKTFKKLMQELTTHKENLDQMIINWSKENEQ